MKMRNLHRTDYRPGPRQATKAPPLINTLLQLGVRMEIRAAKAGVNPPLISTQLQLGVGRRGLSKNRFNGFSHFEAHVPRLGNVTWTIFRFLSTEGATRLHKKSATFVPGVPAVPGVLDNLPSILHNRAMNTQESTATGFVADLPQKSEIAPFLHRFCAIFRENFMCAICLPFSVPLCLCGLFLLGFPHAAHSAGPVIVYTSQDQEYAEPILKGFTDKTGVQVLTVYDSEAVKTVGLVNRLFAERNRPQCDLFWNNEELRTRQLASQGVLAQTNGWDVFGFRTRQLVFNTNLIAIASRPKSMAELTNKIYFGKVALAYPLFGTTSTHFLALRQLWGPDRWTKWCRALQANKPFVVDGNSVVVRLVGKGEAAIGVTDSDDVLSGQREGLPIASFRLQGDGLKIQNTVGVIRNGPHPEAARQLMDFLRSESVVRQLRQAGAVEVDGGEKTIQVNWDELIKNQAEGMDALKGIFLR